MNARHVPALALCAALAIPAGAHAQSAQPWSIQPSFLAAGQDIRDELVFGIGFEGQLRYTPRSLWSGGIGVRYSTHSSDDIEIDILGIFVEPRYTIDIGSDRAAPYLAGRVGFLRQSSEVTQDDEVVSTFSSGFGIGAGAGLLVRLTERVNVDAGAALFQQSFEDVEIGTLTVSSSFIGYVAKIGISVGFGER